MTYFDNSSYPFTTKFFRWDLSTIPNFKPIVFQQFRDYSQVNDKTAKSYLIYVPAVVNPLDPSEKIVTSPVVKVVNLDPGLLGYTPPTGDQIELDKTFLGELDPLLRIDNKNTELQARAQVLLEATVLHELVHYIRRKDGGVGTARGRAELEREEKIARRFERAAYGKRYIDDVLGMMTVRSLGLTQFMPKTATRSVG